MPLLATRGSASSRGFGQFGGSAPAAPTIGTATITFGQQSASVTFTPPTDTGGLPITNYIVTSSPGGFTGSGTSSPVTVSGLTGDTTYTFTVQAVNAAGTSPASASSNSQYAEPSIGQSYQGGYFVGYFSTTANGVANYRLVVAPKSAEVFNTSGVTNWKTSNSYDTPNSTFDGTANTNTLGTSSTYPAAKYCYDLSLNGYTDWYLPARWEMEIAYYNLKPTTAANSTAIGTNDYSVPKRTTNYTTTVPGQTSVTAFQDGGSEYFVWTTLSDPTDIYLYWTSTTTGDPAIVANFYDGLRYTALKITKEYFVRPFRRVAI